MCEDSGGPGGGPCAHIFSLRRRAGSTLTRAFSTRPGVARCRGGLLSLCPGGSRLHLSWPRPMPAASARDDAFTSSLEARAEAAAEPSLAPPADRAA